jgi:Trk-type K+ transport system membrane component
MQKLRPLNKKGQLGLDTVRAVMTTFLVLAVLGVAILLALVSLQDADLFTADSTADNSTDNIINNVSDATADFFSNTGTIMSILVVVVIILAISIIIITVRRFGGSRGV